MWSAGKKSYCCKRHSVFCTNVHVHHVHHVNYDDDYFGGGAHHKLGAFRQQHTGTG